MVALRHTSVCGYHTGEQPPKPQRPSGAGKCYCKSDDLNAKNFVRTKTGLEKIQGWVGHLFSGIGLHSILEHLSSWVYIHEEDTTPLIQTESYTVWPLRFCFWESECQNGVSPSAAIRDTFANCFSTHNAV